MMGEGHTGPEMGADLAGEARQARLFRFIAWVSIAVAIVVLIAFVVAGVLNPAFPLQYLGPAVVAFLVGDATALWLSYRGRQDQAIDIQLVVTTIFVFFVIHFANGASGPFAILLVAIPVWTGMLRGGRAVFWTVIPVGVVYAALFALESGGVLPARDILGSALPWVGFGTTLALIAGVSAIVWAFSAQIQQTLFLARRRAQALAEAERTGRVRREEALDRLRLTVQQYVAFLEQVSAGDLGARLSFEEPEPDETSAKELRVLGEYLNATVVTLVRALDDTRAVQRRYARQSWAQYVRSGPAGSGFRFRDGKSVPSDRSWLPSMARAVEERDAVVSADQLALPLTLSGEIIGVIGARRDVDGSGVPSGWSEDELAVIRAATDQLSQTMETLRLLDQTQRSAASQRAIAQATGQMRQPLDLEDLLRTAVNEIRDALDLDELVLNLTAKGLSDGDGFT